MQIGQEGDTRKFRPAKKGEYYEAKSAVDAQEREPTHWPRCAMCGDKLDDTRIRFGVPGKEQYCHRCWWERP